MPGSEGELATVVLATPIGALGVTASDRGLRGVTLPANDAPRPSAGSVEAAALASDTANQLEEYFDGSRMSFELELDWDGLDERHRRVLEMLTAAAPFGRTVTYGELGRLAGEPDPREVGVMMARNPIPLVVPCHRVVASDGLGGYGGGLDLKRRLLELEGVLPPRLPLV
ncbi:MAG: methylated-DNA--[protein]-cysteine S-methyltransferase [Gaiellaceae bacterium]